MNAQKEGFGRILVISIMLTLGCSLVRVINELDIWYHLVIGKKIFLTGRVPATEFFVYPHLGEAVSFHEWGFGLIHYMAFHWGGYWGMSFLNAAIGLGTLFFLYLAAKKEAQDRPLPLLMLGVLLFFLYNRLVYRPEMVLFLCLAGQIFLLERFCRSGNWKLLLPIPLLALLLSNCHPSVLFLLVVQGFYAVHLTACRRNDRAVATAGIFASLLAVSFAAACLNPYGYSQVLLPVHFWGSKDLLGSITEFLPTFKTAYKWPFVAFVASSLLVLLFSSRRRIVDWLLFFAFGWLAFRYARNVALFALVMYVPLVKGLRAILDERLHSWAERSSRALWVPAALASVVALAVPLHKGALGAGPEQASLPVQSAKTIARLAPSGRLFNFYDYGGFLAWELDGRYQVSIDGRHYGEDKSLLLHDYVFTAAPLWKEKLDAYKVAMVMTPATMPYSGTLIPLVKWLALDPEWVLLVQEPAGLLFVRRGAVPASAVSGLGKESVWHQVVQEGRAVLRDYPESAQAYASMGKAFLMLRDYPSAKEAYETYCRMRPDDREAAALLSLVTSGRMGGVGVPERQQ